MFGSPYDQSRVFFLPLTITTTKNQCFVFVDLKATYKMCKRRRLNKNTMKKKKNKIENEMKNKYIKVKWKDRRRHRK